MNNAIFKTIAAIFIVSSVGLYGACPADMELSGFGIENLNSGTNKEVDIYNSKKDGKQNYAINAQDVKNYIDKLINVDKLQAPSIDSGPPGGTFTEPATGRSWAVRNSYVENYPDGTPIRHPFDGSETNTFSYPDVFKDAQIESLPPNRQGQAYFGLLYQWNAAMKSSTAEKAQGICPNGWHIPSHAEVRNFFVNFYKGGSGYDNTVSTSLTETGWTGTTIGKNIRDGGPHGVNMRYAGFRDTSGKFVDRDVGIGFWTSTQVAGNPNRAWFWYLSDTNDGVLRNHKVKNFAASVRCIKDETP